MNVHLILATIMALVLIWSTALSVIALRDILMPHASQTKMSVHQTPVSMVALAGIYSTSKCLSDLKFSFFKIFLCYLYMGSSIN